MDASTQAANGTIALGANSIHKIKIEYYFNRDNKNGSLQTNNTATLKATVSYPGKTDADINTVLFVS